MVTEFGSGMAVYALRPSGLTAISLAPPPSATPCLRVSAPLASRSNRAIAPLRTAVTYTLPPSGLTVTS